MVDPLFEAMTHSAVKSGLINERAMLHVHAHTVREHTHRAYKRYDNKINVFRFSFYSVFEMHI